MTNLWKRRRGETNIAPVTVESQAPAQHQVITYRPRVFDAEPSLETACIEICKSAQFPSTLHPHLAHDILAEGMHRETLHQVLQDAALYINSSRSGSIHELRDITARGIQSARVMEKPHTRIDLPSYCYITSVHVVRGEEKGCGAAVIHLSPCVRPCGRRQNVVVCIASHPHVVQAGATAAFALAAFKRMQGQPKNDESTVEREIMLGDMGHAVIRHVRYFFSARVYSHTRPVRAFAANARTEAAVEKYFACAGFTSREVLRLPDKQPAQDHERDMYPTYEGEIC